MVKIIFFTIKIIDLLHSKKYLLFSIISFFINKWFFNNSFFNISWTFKQLKEAILTVLSTILNPTIKSFFLFEEIKVPNLLVK